MFRVLWTSIELARWQRKSRFPRVFLVSEVSVLNMRKDASGDGTYILHKDVLHQ